MLNRLLILLCLVSTLAVAEAPSYRVRWVGELRQIVQSGADVGILSLNQLRELDHLYGLGPMEGRDGEITIFDSHPVRVTVENSLPVIHADWLGRAALMVYAQVPRWRQLDLASVHTLLELEDKVQAAAQASGLDLTSPIPFRVTGHAQHLGLHILDRHGREVTGHEGHREIQVGFSYEQVEVELLGFWSDRHQGTFTHVGSHLHVHGRLSDGRNCGHVEELGISSGVLWLPENP